MDINVLAFFRLIYLELKLVGIFRIFAAGLLYNVFKTFLRSSLNFYPRSKPENLGQLPEVHYNLDNFDDACIVAHYFSMECLKIIVRIILSGSRHNKSWYSHKNKISGHLWSGSFAQCV